MAVTMIVPPTGPPIRLSTLNRPVRLAVRVCATADSQAWSRPLSGG